MSLTADAPVRARIGASALFTTLGIVALVVAAGIWLIDPTNAPLQDFVEYWAAGRANLAGDNPYDAVTIYRYERSVSPELTDAIMMWNPPWTLAIAMPFALLPARVGFLIWASIQLLIVLGCADFLWRYFGGAAKYRWIASLVAMLFVPTFFVLRMGQITPLLLLGVVGFLWAVRHDRHAWAGAFLALTTIKPHLLYLFVAAALIWATTGRRWRLLLGFGTTLVVATLVPLATNLHVWAQYQFALTHQPPQMLSPTIGAWLRLAFGTEKLWLQYIPVVCGFGWLAVYGLNQHRHWVWEAHASALLLMSILTTNYGAWPFDLVVLLVPVIQVAVSVWREEMSRGLFALAILITFGVLALLTMNVHWAEQYRHVWMTPMIMLAYMSFRPRVVAATV